MNKPLPMIEANAPLMLRVHPVADRYPMLSEGEIAELAEDIKTHGLIHEIMVDDDLLIDGRNRLKACELAGVKPTFRQFPWGGDDAESKEQTIVAYIVSENLRRRHLNAGQRAILLALAYPEPTPGKRMDLLATGLETKQVNKTDLSHARAICRWAPEFVEIILNGGGEFSKAFKIADERREQAAQVSALMDRLAKDAPDLHALVLEAKGMTAAEGVAALEARIKAEAEAKAEQERQRQEALSEQKRREDRAAKDLRERQENGTTLVAEALAICFPHGGDPGAWAQRLWDDINLEFWPPNAIAAATPEAWASCAKVMAGLAQLIRERKTP